MNMEIEQYWPQHKVFFIATLSLFPEHLKDRIVTELFYKPYFLSDDIVSIGMLLEEYQKRGYIEYENDGEYAYKITEIHTQKANDDLIEYLDGWQSNKLRLLSINKPADYSRQRKLLQTALVRAYRLNPGNQLRITLEDIYGSPSSDIFGTPFWELVLSMQLTEDPKANIMHIGYDRSEGGLHDNSAQPFADIKITDTELLRSLELAAKPSEPISDEEPQETQYNGLRANRDESISYQGLTVPFTPQEVAIMRVFLARPEEWRPDDAFTDPLADVFNEGKERKKSHHTVLSQSISRTRLKLNAAVGKDQNCIINQRNRGWKLQIQPAE